MVVYMDPLDNDMQESSAPISALADLSSAAMNLNSGYRV